MYLEGPNAILGVEGILVGEVGALGDSEAGHRRGRHRRPLALGLEGVEDEVDVEGEPAPRPGLTRLGLEEQVAREDGGSAGRDLEQTGHGTAGRRGRGLVHGLGQGGMAQPTNAHLLVVLEHQLLIGALAAYDLSIPRHPV
jgi:hypothetical protein